MFKRTVCTLVVAAMVFSMSACRLRADLSRIPEGEKLDEIVTTTTTTQTTTLHMDEMSKYAWEIYETALEKEREFREFDLRYICTQTTVAETSTATARLQKAVDGVDTHEICLNSLQYGKEVSGYYKGGVGYFNLAGNKYWLFTNEEKFMEELGFSESVTLTADMFAEAVVMENADGTKTVSCPLAAKYAVEYAELAMNSELTSATVTLNVTVDANGTPVEFFNKITAEMPLYGTVTMEETNRYETVGSGVVITPPEDLDSYNEFKG